MPIRVLSCWPQPSRRQKHGWMLSQSLLLAWEWTMKLSGLKWGFTLDCLHVDPTSAVSVDTHGVSCQFSKGCHPRHAAVNDVLKRSLTGGSKDPITSRAIWHLQSWRQTTRWSVHRSMETGQSPGVGFHMPRHFGPLLRTPCNKQELWQQRWRPGRTWSMLTWTPFTSLSPQQMKPLGWWDQKQGSSVRIWAGHHRSHIGSPLQPTPATARINCCSAWQCCCSLGHTAAGLP